MNSLGCVLMSIIGALVILTISEILYQLFGVAPNYTMYGFLVVGIILILKSFWEIVFGIPHRLKIILQILAVNAEEMLALEIIEQSQGELSRGSIYSELNLLVDEGFVSKRVEERTEPYLPRHYYKITSSGRRHRFHKTAKLKLRHVFSYSGHSKSGFLFPVDFQELIYYN